ncbi:Cir_N domain-containing protein/CWC25 domain-containing protein [Cephalotus follicularis]|uniref:Cir_N domain-containing protein/CWC25 domain-containing protein n=1 Tax=Cephalotus follicularis TaxID=3775 RepID=A0A1Q3BQI6_CEPFO|nr:Cir_N domain-containing protein/CWC25 domain-containing protein [Cephalotus follicularis]
MGMKFLNKKGWHTGSLRNIENVWKAEQKHDAEQKKLDELRKQILEERERSEFRLLQEQAGLIPKQERLDFLYDSGISVGRVSSSSDAGGSKAGAGGGFKALEEALPTTKPTADPQQQHESSAPGALFEDKPHSANDAWRKLHSDPLLLIRQREQEALARIKNNPVQMAIIRKSLEEKNHKDESHDKKERKKKHHKHSSSKQQSDSEGEFDKGDKSRKHKSSNSQDKHYYISRSDSEDEFTKRESRNKSNYRDSKNQDPSTNVFSQPKMAKNDYHDDVKRHHKSRHGKYSSEGRSNFDADRKERGNRSVHEKSSYDSSALALQSDSQHNKRNVATKLSAEERAARLQEMQVDAELHEEQRWRRLKKAEEDDAREATRARISGGRNFLDAAQKSVYGAEKGGSSTIEESVRRRTHYSQGRSEAEGNAFRR